jgi:cytochrome b6-f complex iron-sulfur subunit
MEIDRQTRRQFCSRTCSAAAVAALGGAVGAVLQSCGGGGFCSRTCSAAAVAALGGAVGAVLQSCGGGGSPTSPSGSGAAALPTVNGTVAGSSLVVTIDASSPLAAVGSLALVQSSAGSVLVAHTSQDAFTALSSGCTHQACAITGYSGQNFVCPCHGSVFSTSGRVVSGPAPTALRQYATQFTGGVLTITA